MDVKNYFIWIFSFMAFFSCREAYVPDIRPSDTQVLVVEGFINASGGPTTIRLSRSRNLNDSLLHRDVSGAMVVLEGEGNETYTLMEIGNGHYQVTGISVDPLRKYRIRIRVDEKDYASAFEGVKLTPPIDSISWQRKPGGVEIQVNTHDDLDSSRYYRWDYIETWEYHSKYESQYKYENGAVVPRPAEEARNMFTCWNTEASTRILTGSSQNLETDIISRMPLTFIEQGDIKLSQRYSILVRQQVLGSQAYDFYQLIKKNTEEIGSIFGPLPSEVRGNITCLSNPSEIVIGYIPVSTVEEKRIFISKSELPEWGYDPFCAEVYVPNHPDSFKKYYPAYIPYSMKGFYEGFFSAIAECIDCTLTGSNHRPAFW